MFGRKLPGRGAVASGGLPGGGLDDLHAAGQDALLFLGAEVANVLVQVAVSADLVASGQDGLDRLRVVLDHPAGE